MAELNKPYIRDASDPYSRQSRPHTRQSEPYVRQTRPHTRQSNPYSRKWLAIATQKIFQGGNIFNFQNGSKYVYQ